MSNNLFIITAPSGAGKTTLIKRAIDYAKKINGKRPIIVIKSAGKAA